MSEPALLGPRRLRELLDRHGVRPRKELGQNFVIDPNTIRKVVAIAKVSPEDAVLEIGAGAGSLTLELARAARRVMAVEFDRRLLPLLHEALDGLSNVELVHADVLQMDLEVVDATSMVGNLPYNIAVPVVMRVLERAPQIVDLTVMTQREVGERLAAGPGSKTYGRVSVLVQYRARAMIAGKVSKRVFYPAPDVDSVIVRIERRERLPEVDQTMLSSVVTAAFAHRRKTLRNTLASLAGSPTA
ncbi:MAG: 16S rRNA (adenine(1518)-N(6)/adenine(1519)-N(6))-dimethyltransferase RsmA, partial [Actinomycetota bacterium]